MIVFTASGTEKTQNVIENDPFMKNRIVDNHALKEWKPKSLQLDLLRAQIMSGHDTLPARMLLRNGALLTIPPMIITFGLWGALPAAYSPDIFWKNIPGWLGLLENMFRILVFSLPGILYFGKRETGQLLGWSLYVGGLAVYLASYLAQIVFPASVWSQSAVGFTAPAWSTLFWFAGIGLVCPRSWLPIPWHRAIYFLGVFTFLMFHVWHTGLVYSHVIH